jgi:diphthamide synthase subunit DPH2
MNKQGRIDHPVGENDDSVIGYLLSCYMVFFGKNLYMYKIDSSLISLDTNQENQKQIYEMSNEHHQYLLNRINELEQSKGRIQSILIHQQVDKEINYLRSLIKDVDINVNLVGVDQLKKHTIAGYTDQSIVNQQKINDLSKIFVDPTTRSKNYNY